VSATKTFWSVSASTPRFWVDFVVMWICSNVTWWSVLTRNKKWLYFFNYANYHTCWCNCFIENLRYLIPGQYFWFTSWRKTLWISAWLFFITLLQYLQKNYEPVLWKWSPLLSPLFFHIFILSNPKFLSFNGSSCQISISRYLLRLPQAGLAPSLLPLNHIFRCVMVCPFSATGHHL
jgi:hypothetical protein